MTALRTYISVADSFGWNRKTVTESLLRQGLKARTARRFKATTNSNHSLPIAPNLLNQHVSAEYPNQKWAGDRAI